MFKNWTNVKQYDIIKMYKHFSLGLINCVSLEKDGFIWLIIMMLL